MRVVIPIFSDSNDAVHLAFTKWNNKTVLEATLEALKKESISDLTVSSNNFEIIKASKRLGVDTLHIKDGLNHTETYLIPGTINTLKECKGRSPDKTLVLWYATPWVNSSFMAYVNKIEFQHPQVSIISVRPCREHPCQMYEPLNLIEQMVFVPIDQNSSNENIFVSEEIPFDWKIRNIIDEGDFYEKSIRKNQVFYRGVSKNRLVRPGAFLWRKINDSKARIYFHDRCDEIIYKGGNQLSPAAFHVKENGESEIGMYQDTETYQLYIIIGEMKAFGENCFLKIWEMSEGGQAPLVMNGVALEKDYGHIRYKYGKGIKKLYRIPNPTGKHLFIIWLVNERDQSGAINVQHSWTPELGGWHMDKKKRTMLNKNGNCINGRQDFPPLFEPDRQICLFEAGFIPDEEASIDSGLVGTTKLHNLFPPRVRNPIDLLKVEEYLAAKKTIYS